MPIFTKEFCSQLIEELKYFEASPMPKGRPNTMNNYGVRKSRENLSTVFDWNIVDSYG